MKKKEHELIEILSNQQVDVSDNHQSLLEMAKTDAIGYVRATEGIAVISDFILHDCHIFSGRFGYSILNLPDYSIDNTSAFENAIFSCADAEELLERHILELRYYNFLKTIPTQDRSNYMMSCNIKFQKGNGDTLTIFHTSRYLNYDDDGNVILGLCTYIPFPLPNATLQPLIFNIATGNRVDKEQYAPSDTKLLSRRQIEILQLMAKGIPSKQIADQLNISVFTVNRHRQDILANLKVANTAAAVEIALRMNLL